MGRSWVAALLVAAVGLPAFAGPYDRTVTLAPGTDDHFEPLGVPARIRVTDPKVVHAERMPTGEILLQAKSRGATDVFVLGDTWVRVWRVRVGNRPPPGKKQALAKAKAACRGLTDEGGKVTVTIATAACVTAVATLAPHLRTGDLSIQWTGTGLQAELVRLGAALAKARPDLARRLSLGYLGANLHIAGTVAHLADLDAALEVLWRASAGPLLLDLSDLRIGSPGSTEGVEAAATRADALPKPGAAASKATDGGTPDASGIEIIRGFDPRHPPR